MIERAKKYLPHSMGKRYKDVVVLCLNGYFNAKVEEPEFTMEFHEKVVEAFQGIRLGK